MLITCKFCGQDNHVPDFNYEGYESFTCWSCMQHGWLLQGMSNFMCRTELNENLALQALGGGKTFGIEGKMNEY